ncbi:hypothetical protein BB560_001532 [Smittium megazygosporum]|uniref:Uncharacterized protein n=1 Tax=Smittium megazygosporum TaxID=133381 RepID=A0A2T9ZHC5_9FUNG|nr:hypothetical protein BB560_001532 [Smittium megazygosporum]
MTPLKLDTAQNTDTIYANSEKNGSKFFRIEISDISALQSKIEEVCDLHTFGFEDGLSESWLKPELLLSLVSGLGFHITRHSENQLAFFHRGFQPFAPNLVHVIFPKSRENRTNNYLNDIIMSFDNRILSENAYTLVLDKDIDQKLFEITRGHSENITNAVTNFLNQKHC